MDESTAVRAESDTQANTDPRVRRTRQWIRDALTELLQEKPFAAISITDLTKRAGIARVTFYQHYDSKEVVLLDLVSDFFAQIYQDVDTAALARFLASDAPVAVEPLQATPQVDPAQANLIRIALEQVGPDVRRLALTSFLQALAASGSALEPAEAQLLATYHVGGVLALLERQLGGELDAQTAAVQLATLRYLRAVLQETAHGRGD